MNRNRFWKWYAVVNLAWGVFGIALFTYVWFHPVALYYLAHNLLHFR